MLILFDNGTPRGLARFLTGHSVEEARARGWEELSNGELIDIAEQAGFDVIVTTDKNIRYQQNLQARKIALVVLENSQWPMVKLVTETIVAAVNGAKPGMYREVAVPFQGLSPRRVSPGRAADHWFRACLLLPNVPDLHARVFQIRVS